MRQTSPRFWRALVPRNGLLTESYTWNATDLSQQAAPRSTLLYPKWPIGLSARHELNLAKQLALRESSRAA
jgi:hypothetical protein